MGVHGESFNASSKCLGVFLTLQSTKAAGQTRVALG